MPAFFDTRARFFAYPYLCSGLTKYACRAARLCTKTVKESPHLHISWMRRFLAFCCVSILFLFSKVDSRIHCFCHAEYGCTRHLHSTFYVMSAWTEQRKCSCVFTCYYPRLLESALCRDSVLWYFVFERAHYVFRYPCCILFSTWILDNSAPRLCILLV